MSVKIFLALDENSRVLGYGSSPFNDQSVEIEVEDNHEVLNNFDVFKMEDGKLLKDLAYQQQLLKEQEEQNSSPDTEEDIKVLKKENQELRQQVNLMEGVVMDIIMTMYS